MEKFTLLSVLCGYAGLGKFTSLSTLCGNTKHGHVTLIGMFCWDAGFGKLTLLIYQFSVPQNRIQPESKNKTHTRDNYANDSHVMQGV